MTSMAPPRSRLLWRGLLTLALLPACGDSPFYTTATYAALGSGLTLWIAAQGTVPSGAELSEVASDLVRFCPTRATGAALDLHLPSPGASDVPDPAALSRRLSAAGFVVNSIEVEEMGLVLAGALAGLLSRRLALRPRAPESLALSTALRPSRG